MTHRATGGDGGNYCPTMSVESSAVYSLSGQWQLQRILRIPAKTNYVLLQQIYCNYVGLRFKHPSIRPLLTKETNLFSVFDCESFTYNIYRCPRPLKPATQLQLYILQDSFFICAFFTPIFTSIIFCFQFFLAYLQHAVTF